MKQRCALTCNTCQMVVEKGWLDQGMLCWNPNLANLGLIQHQRPSSSIKQQAQWYIQVTTSVWVCTPGWRRRRRRRRRVPPLVGTWGNTSFICQGCTNLNTKMYTCCLILAKKNKKSWTQISRPSSNGSLKFKMSNFLNSKSNTSWYIQKLIPAQHWLLYPCKWTHLWTHPCRQLGFIHDWVILAGSQKWGILLSCPCLEYIPVLDQYNLTYQFWYEYGYWQTYQLSMSWGNTDLLPIPSWYGTQGNTKFILALYQAKISLGCNTNTRLVVEVF